MFFLAGPRRKWPPQELSSRKSLGKEVGRKFCRTEFISEVSKKIKDYEDEILELKGRFGESLKNAKEMTSDDHPMVTLANELLYLQKKVSNLKERMIAKKSEAEALSEMIDADQKFFEKFQETSTYMKKIKESTEKRLGELQEYGGTVAEFRDLKRKVTEEKQQMITSKRKDESEVEEKEEEEPESKRYDQSRSHVTGTANIKGSHTALANIANLCKSSLFAESAVFKDLKSRYDELGDELKQCLLCFSVFPENAEIKKRVMTYWWIGEGFVPPVPKEEGEHKNHNKSSTRNPKVCVPPSKKQQNNNNSSNSKTLEEYANDFFYELIAKDFIQPSSKSSPGPASLLTGVKTCKMDPFVRSTVITLAKSVNFFDFDNDMNVTSDYSSSHRACLTAGKRLEFNTKNLNSLYTLFNVSEAILQFNPELF